MKRCLLTLLILLVHTNGFSEPRSLESLIDEALSCSKVLQAEQSHVGALQQEQLQQWAAFIPHIEAEGGAVNEDISIRKDSFLYGGVHASWNLYRGGEDLAILKQKEAEYQKACFTIQGEEKRIEYSVATEFFHLLYLQQTIALYDKALAINEGNSATAERMWQSGITTEADVLEFELQRDSLSTEQELLRKEIFQHRNELSILLSNPCEAVNLEVFGQFAKEQKLEACDLYETAICERSDFQQSKWQLEILEKEKKQVCSRYKPSIDLGAFYGKEPETEEDRAIGTKVFITATVPLFQGGKNYRGAKSAQCRIHEERLRQEQLEESIYTEIRVALSKLEMARERLASAKRRQGRVERYWELTQEEYRRGVKNSPDLANAAEQLLMSQLQVISGERDYSLALVEVAHFSGFRFHKNPWF